MTYHVEEERIAVTVRTHRRHPGSETGVDRHRHAEIFRFAPEGIVGGIVEAASAKRIGTDEDRFEAQLLDDPAHLAHRFVHVKDRHRRDAEQPLRTGTAEISEPVAVGAAGRGLKTRLGKISVEQKDRRIEDGDVDSFAVHDFDTFVRIVPAARNVVPRKPPGLLEIGKAAGHHRGGNGQIGAASILAHDEQFVASVAIAPDLNHLLAEFGLGVFVPDRGRFDDMTVGVDYGWHGWTDLRWDASSGESTAECAEMSSAGDHSSTTLSPWVSRSRNASM